MMHLLLVFQLVHFISVEVDVDFSARSAHSCVTETDCGKDSRGANLSWFFFFLFF